MKKTTTILCAALALSLAGCSRSKTPVEATSNMYQAIQNHQYEKALKYTNAEGEKREILLQTFQSFDYNQIIEYTILDTFDDCNDSTASVAVSLTTVNDSSPDTIRTDIDVPCIKQGRNWKVAF